MAKGASTSPEIISIVIENVDPCVDGGKFPAKCVAGELVTVTADIFKDGHDVLRADLKYRVSGGAAWKRSPMKLIDNDRWAGSFTPDKNATYEYTIEAWKDPVASWAKDAEKKCAAGVFARVDTLEGLKVLDRVLKAASAREKTLLMGHAGKLKESNAVSGAVLKVLQDENFKKLVQSCPVCDELTELKPGLMLTVDRAAARASAWYELFPRSQGRTPGRSGTFRDCILRLPEIKRMGFDVIYLPPIHPIGKTNRKGPGNTLASGKDDPGSPWAIGDKTGGHKAVHPDLGTMRDFEAFVRAAREEGIEIALDYALQCSPDHPYVKEHPEWFCRLPDGSIRHAENPPKKYEDIYPFDFGSADRDGLIQELKSIVEFWISKGVKIFRVDNPHTKPFWFWSWLIGEIQKNNPEVLFLAEAFTRPKVMKYLAKTGFSQSYTYFTWRNHKQEIREYLEELTQTPMNEYYRGNFFANTPDILTEILQKGGQPAFKMRLVLAATLSSVYGIYSGFELCENRAKAEGSEEYLNSEKYEHKVWDWDRPGNIKDYIARVNRIRTENPALQEYKNLEFYSTKGEHILCYGKRTKDNGNIIVVVVNLDPKNIREDVIELPLWKFGIDPADQYEMQDLLTGNRYFWKGAVNYVKLSPAHNPAHIFKLKK